MAFLDEQGLQHLVDKINVRSSKTLPDNAPDGTIIINPDEDTEIFNVNNVDVDSELSLNSTNPVQNRVVTKELNNKINKTELATIATTGNYDDLSNKPVIPETVSIDDNLNDTSINPVQNKVIKTALDNKHDKDTNILVGTTDYRSLGFNDKYCLRFDANTIGQTPVGMKVIINGNDAGRLVGENAFTNDNYAFTGAYDKYDGEAGLVPAPIASDKNRFLRGDGTWATIPKNDITVDTELNDTSTNPIQNKAVNTAINAVKSNMTQCFQTLSDDIPTKITDLEIDIPIASTAIDNTWTKSQTFDAAILSKEVYQTEYASTSGDTPTITPARSTMCFTMTEFSNGISVVMYTLDMSTIVANCLSASNTSTVFTAYIKCDDEVEHGLTITNAGTIKYIGSASDVAFTSAGLLLNIMMLKDASGNVTSIVQANKLT